MDPLNIQKLEEAIFNLKEFLEDIKKERFPESSVSNVEGVLKQLQSKLESVKSSGKVASMLDDIASRLESKGLLKEAHDLDIISNTLEMLASNQEVKALYEATKEMNPSHAATLIGERHAGSKWGENLTEQKLTSLPWEEYKDAKIPGVMLPFCRYFVLKNAGKHFPGSKQRVETLEDAEKAGHKISVQKGAHGNFEIISPDVPENPVMEAWLIVGPAEGADGKEIPGKSMIWTLYPGMITGADPKWDGKIESIPDDRKKYVAVKAPEVKTELPTNV